MCCLRRAPKAVLQSAMMILAGIVIIVAFLSFNGAPDQRPRAVHAGRPAAIQPEAVRKAINALEMMPGPGSSSRPESLPSSSSRRGAGWRVRPFYADGSVGLQASFRF